MLDRCGYSIQVGAQVDVYVGGVVKAIVMEVKDGGLADTNGNIENGYVLLNIIVPLRSKPGDCASCYVTADPPTAEPKSKLEMAN